MTILQSFPPSPSYPFVAVPATEVPSPEIMWQTVQAEFHRRLGTPLAEMVGSLHLSRTSQNKVELSVPTLFLKVWVSEKYGLMLLKLWQEVQPSIQQIRVVVRRPERLWPSRQDAPTQLISSAEELLVARPTVTPALTSELLAKCWLRFFPKPSEVEGEYPLVDLYEGESPCLPVEDYRVSPCVDVGPPRVLTTTIIMVVGTHYGMMRREMLSASRKHKVALARSVAMYLARHMTKRTFPEIGRSFDRDHTTVLHALRKIEARRLADPLFQTELTMLENQILIRS